jgi:hypothetical protein
MTRFDCTGGIASLALLLAGCAASSEPGQRGAESAPDDGAEAMVERTIVVMNADGTDTVKTEQITAEQLRRDIAAREARASAPMEGRGGEHIGAASEAISVDSGCGDSSLWIFDNTGNAPGPFPFNHELCFYNDGAGGCEDLRKYVRFCGFPAGRCDHWATYPPSSNWVGSYWAGTDEGFFTGIDGFYYGTQSFGVFERIDDAQSQYWVKNAQFVCFF